MPGSWKYKDPTAQANDDPELARLERQVFEQRQKVQMLQQEWHDLSGRVGTERTALWKLECARDSLKGKQQ